MLLFNKRIARLSINGFILLVGSVLVSTSGGLVSLALSTSNNNSQTQMTKKRRQLPEKLLVGYTTRCSEKVPAAVRQGVNVLIWAFAEFELTQKTTNCVPKFDLHCAQQMIQELDAEGFTDTVHLVSFGGWNGPHFPNIVDSSNSNSQEHAQQLYHAWKSVFGSHFHGIDWDFEGHDNLSSPTNVFSVDCLETVGEFSILSNKDGYIVGMAPPQSYLDIESRSFSRRVDWRDTRGWHDDFQYFGRNVYAYWLSKYGHTIDFVSVQFYESYSRAGLEVFHNKIPPQIYLENYVRDLVTNRKEGFYVDFGDDDPSLEYPNRWVPFPLRKLVWGFANSWGFNDDEKVCYFDPQEHIAVAYESLKESDHAPRGFMFWVIDEEDEKDINFSKSLNKILRIRKDVTCHSNDDMSPTMEDKTE